MATLGALAALIDAKVHGDPDRAVDAVADLASAGPRHLSFLATPKYQQAFYSTKAAGVLVAEVLANPPCTLLVCADPYLALAKVATLLHPQPQPVAGIAQGAHVATDARVASTASVAAGAIIEAGAEVGARTVVHGGVFVGRNARIGDDCLLHAGAKVLHACRLGHRVIVHAGAVIGSDGFGFAVDRSTGQRHKIPQAGIVEIDDDVEIGANSTIDRATFGATRIGAGTKIDNLVQIAHNVVLGRDCVVVSQSGIAGSTTLGDRVVIGAQGGIVGHIKICNDVTLGARAGVPGHIDAPGIYSGAPVMPHRQWLRMVMAQPAVPELRRRVRELETRLAALEKVS